MQNAMTGAAGRAGAGTIDCQIHSRQNTDSSGEILGHSVLLAAVACLTAWGAYFGLPAPVAPPERHVERTQHCAVIDLLVTPFGITKQYRLPWQQCDELVPLYLRWKYGSKNI